MSLFVLAHAEARRRAAAACMESPDGYVVRIAPPTRSGDQNAKFHAICHELSKSPVQWFGKRRDLDEWKALLVSGHAAATKQGGEVVPGIEGELVAIRESTARMSKARGASLIDYAEAFVASHIEASA